MIIQTFRRWLATMFTVRTPAAGTRAAWSESRPAHSDFAAESAHALLETQARRRELKKLRANAAARHAPRPVAHAAVFDDSVFAAFRATAASNDAGMPQEYARTMLVPRKPSRPR
ncbi:MAG: hypothetical protein ABWZ88_08345 [Variovorax sp.]